MFEIFIEETFETLKHYHFPCEIEIVSILSIVYTLVPLNCRVYLFTYDDDYLELGSYSNIKSSWDRCFDWRMPRKNVDYHNANFHAFARSSFCYTLIGRGQAKGRRWGLESRLFLRWRKVKLAAHNNIILIENSQNNQKLTNNKKHIFVMTSIYHPLKKILSTLEPTLNSGKVISVAESVIRLRRTRNTYSSVQSSRRRRSPSRWCSTQKYWEIIVKKWRKILHKKSKKYFVKFPTYHTGWLCSI